MSWQRRQPILLLAACLLASAVSADYGVHIMSKYRQRITSTTLNWLPRSHFDSSREIVIGGFEITEAEGEPSSNNQEKTETSRPLYVCRVYHTTVWLAGSQRANETRCTVTLHGNVQSYEKYDLLENVDSAARVNWQPWDKYTQIPIGTVATEDMYVARHAVDDEEKNLGTTSRYTHYIGTLDIDDNLGTISFVRADGTQGTAKTGDVLVETEPIGYNLTRVKLNWSKKQGKRTPRNLGVATIVNEGPEPVKMAKAFTYTYKYSIYWGQGHAILKGPNVSITLANDTELPKIIWGTMEESNRTDVYTVEVYLEPGTGVNVTLKGNYTDMEVPYTGTLISHYEDGETKSRMISSFRREKSMFDVTPEFGPVFFLGNQSLVPTTTQAPTTTMATTPLEDRKTWETKRKSTLELPRPEDQESIDENLIVPPKKTDMNMQSDDGGPLSLKNKDDSGAAAMLANLALLSSGLLLLALDRVT